MTATAYLMPRVWPIDGSGGPLWVIGGIVLLSLGIALAAWRGVPAVTGHAWHPHPDAAHLHTFGQRAADATAGLPLILLGIGALQRDWLWYAIALATLLLWLGVTLAVGFAREQADPSLPKTTAEIITPEDEPVVPEAVEPESP